MPRQGLKRRQACLFPLSPALSLQARRAGLSYPSRAHRAPIFARFKMSDHSQEQNQPGRINFDRTINLGHILTVISFIIVTIMQWNLMDKRIVVLEEARTAQRERDIAQDSASREKFQEVKEAINDLRRSVEKVGDKVGVK